MTLSTASRKVAPRVAICGSGVAGPVLGAILSRKFGDRIKLDLFERTPHGSDQGYGLDLDSHGQEALVRAGVYDRFWEISVPGSDVMLAFDGKGNKHLAFFRPRLFQMLWPSTWAAQPESNRGGIRQICLDALEECQAGIMHYGEPVKDLQKVTSAGGATALELLGTRGQVLGEYDLVVDAMGWNSTLRRYRVEDEGYQTQYAGSVMVHGSCDDPEATWPAELLDRFGTAGTLAVFGAKTFGFQRYGCGAGDRRTSFSFTLDYPENPNSIFTKIGITKPTSRKSSIMTGDDCEKVKHFIHAELGGSVHSMYHAAVDALDRVTVRPNYTHGGDVQLKKTCDLPLVCIGDALANCGAGGGGILAMHDTTELADILSRDDAFDDVGKVNLQSIRDIEPIMLERKRKFRERKAGFTRQGEMPNLDHGCFVGMHAFLKKRMPTAEDASFFKRMCMPGLRVGLAGLIAGIGAVTRRCNPVGSDPTNARLYTNVRQALEQEHSKQRTHLVHKGHIL